MISKIVWPYTFEKGNPFGGNDGFRPLTITFHNSSFANISDDEQKALDILFGLARLDNVDAMSFDDSVSQKIIIDNEIVNGKYRLRTINGEGEITWNSGISTSWLEPKYIAHLLGGYNSNEGEKYRPIRQELLEARSHGALRRDIFITTSVFLLKNKDKLAELNICTPKEALKITGLYLRMEGEFEWISHIKGKVRFSTSRKTFYEDLSRGLLPNSWKYLSALSLHEGRKELISLGWSVLERYSRALQTRDKLGRLFYMPATSSSMDQMVYHFDYLTLLLTAVLDAQALIINKVYHLGLSDQNCGFRRRNFKKAIQKIFTTNNLDKLLSANADFTDILFDLRNKIHSVSLETDFHVPKNDPDELLERIYQFDQNEHGGIQKENLTVIENGGDPIASIKYSVDMYNLANNLIDEATKLINSVMEETKIEDFLDPLFVPKIRTGPPDYMLPYVQTYLLLA